MRTALAIVWACSRRLLALAADANDDAVKKGAGQVQRDLEGRPLVVHDGKRGSQAIDLEKGSPWTVKGSEYTFRHGDVMVEGTHKLDPTTKTPKTIDAVRTSGPDQGKTLLGIYELNDDTYKVCRQPRPGKRTADRVRQKQAPASGDRLLIKVMKREKP